MNKIIIPVLASVLVLGVLGTAEDAFAPAPQKPEKLTVESISWDTKSQEFLGEYLVQFGIGRAGNEGNFVIVTTLTIVGEGFEAGEVTGQSTPSDDVFEVDYTPSSPLAIQLRIPFDPIANGVKGPVDVTVEAKILNPAGKPVAIAEPKTFEDIELSFPPEICDDEIDNDGDGLVDGDDPDCNNDPIPPPTD